MQYLTQELKICVKEKRSDIESGFGYEELIEKPIINFETDHPFGFHKEHIVWRTSVWNLAINRNFEIWKTLSTTKLENSIGELTDYAKKSLKGKLGAGNKKYFEKDKSNKWTFIKFKETKYENVFKPFSDQAIGKCRERARGK
jgi:hypothetical protein